MYVVLRDTYTFLPSYMNLVLVQVKGSQVLASGLLAQSCVLYEAATNKQVTCMGTAWKSQTPKRENSFEIMKICMGKESFTMYLCQNQ